MKKSNRRVLFWLAALMFAICTWIVIRYAQGYAYDFGSNTFVRTGAIAVTTNTGATLTVDDRRVGDTSFIGNHAGDDGLLPGTYDVRLVRDGFSQWRKSVVVEEGKLTDFPQVMLLPTDDESILSLKQEASRSLQETFISKPTRVIDGDFALEKSKLFDISTASPSLIAEQVLGFSIADDNSRLLWWTRNELWVMWLRNTNDQPYRSDGQRQAVTRFSVPIKRASWFRDTEHIVADLGNQSYRVIETDSRGSTNIIKL